MAAGRAVFLWLLLSCCGLVSASVTIVLNKPEIASPAAAAYYLDETGRLRVNTIASLNKATLRSLDYDQHFNLRKDSALWLRFKLHYPRRNALIEELEPNSWYVEVPNALFDRVHLYEQKADGSFFPTQIAGDLVASRFWTNPAKHPLFRLRLQPGETHTIYLRLNNSTRATASLNIVNQTEVLPRQRLSSLIYGGVSGALLLAALYSLVVALFLKDRSFLLFSLYCFVSLGMNLAYSGVLAQYIFSGQPHVVDASHGTLTLLGWSVSLFFVRRLCIETSAVWGKVMRWVALAYLMAACLFFFVPRFPYGMSLIALLVPAAPLLSLYTAWNSYRNGDRLSLWILMSYALFSALILIILCMIFGVLPRFLPLEAMILLSQTAIIPPLLTVLHARSTQQQVIALRGQTLTRNDALTGLLKEPLLQKRIGAMQYQPLSVRIRTAVVVLHVANLNRIALSHDSCTAEQSLLRTVIKIKRVLGDVSGAARVGHARIAFVISGTGKEEVRILAQELIVLGLSPSRKIQPAVPLHYQFAIGFFDPVDVGSDGQLLEKLHSVLDGLSSRTRRPIRFLDEQEQEQQEQIQRAAEVSGSRDDDTRSEPDGTAAAFPSSLPRPSAFGSGGFGPIDRPSELNRPSKLQ